jgi:hypothetical protein
MAGMELEENIFCLYSCPLDICWYSPRRTLGARTWTFQIVVSWIRTLLGSWMSFWLFLCYVLNFVNRIVKLSVQYNCCCFFTSCASGILRRSACCVAYRCSVLYFDNELLCCLLVQCKYSNYSRGIPPFRQPYHVSVRIHVFVILNQSSPEKVIYVIWRE